MKKSTLAVLVGSLSLGALATGCASSKSAEKAPAAESTESTATDGTNTSTGTDSATGTDTGATQTQEKGEQGSGQVTAPRGEAQRKPPIPEEALDGLGNGRCQTRLTIVTRVPPVGGNAKRTSSMNERMKKIPRP